MAMNHTNSIYMLEASLLCELHAEMLLIVVANDADAGFGNPIRDLRQYRKLQRKTGLTIGSDTFNRRLDEIIGAV